MSSFGANLVPSQRHVFSEHALGNWFRVLSHMHEMQTVQPTLPVECVATVEKDTSACLHFYPRSDVKFVVGAMKVWALSRYLQTPLMCFLSFDEIINTTIAANKSAFLDSISYYVANTVTRSELPLQYQLPAALEFSSEKVSLSEEGVLLLYATWHVLLLHEKLAAVEMTVSTLPPCEPCLKEIPFTTQELTRLDAIQGCLELEPTDIYAQPSNANVFWRVKNSTMLAVEKTRIASNLFEFNPTTYADLFLGQAFLLSKKFKLAFCYGDEILWTPGPAVWLWIDAEQTIISLVNNGVPELIMHADSNAIFYLHTVLVARS